jgi:trans-aconitate 2-methyltransferase
MFSLFPTPLSPNSSTINQNYILGYNRCTMKYVFASDELGGERLLRLHELFSEFTESFLEEYGEKNLSLCLDLGCGPGFTTRLVADTLSPQNVIGLDNSEYFIRKALEFSRDYPTISYQIHDVTKIPFPTEKADLIFFRFVLTHMAKCMESLHNWSGQLKENGLILLEETDSIQTNVSVFRKYLDIADRLLESNGNRLYVGELLENAQYRPFLEKKISRLSHVPATLSQAAKIFQYNILAWRKQKFIKENCSREELDDLEKEMVAFTKSTDESVVIEWTIRQIVLQKAG